MAYRSESLAFKINGNSLVAQRPTYEELAKKVEDLEKESLELKLAKDALREGEHRIIFSIFCTFIQELICN